MKGSSRSSIFGYGVIAVGSVLAFVSAVVPFYTAGYQLKFGVLVVGITPYLTYGLVVALLRRTLTNIAGMILLTLHAWLVISERFVGGADYAGDMIYFAPLALTVALIPLVILALREPWQ